MDKSPFTGLVMTASLNSIVTDSAPGASCYSTGNLKVLLGGGRKWFLPKNASPNGSARSNANDSVLPADLATAWGVPVGALEACPASSSRAAR